MDAAGNAIAFPAAIAASPANAVRRAPKRSAVRPPGICIAMCTRNCVVVSSPTVASPTPYACDMRVATAPMAAMFQPTAMPTPMPPAAASLLLAEVGGVVVVVELELVVLVVVRADRIVLVRLGKQIAHASPLSARG